MRRALLFFGLISLFLPGIGRAEAEFFGVKMPSESFASGVTLQPGVRPSEQFPLEQGVDRNVYAYASIDGGMGAGSGISITVVNDSPLEIKTASVYSEYTVVTRSGERYTLETPDPLFLPATQAIASGSRAGFRPSFGGLKLRREEIRYIICSYDMGETKIVMIPMTQVTTAPSTAASEYERPEPVRTQAPKPEPLERTSTPAVPKTAGSKTAAAPARWRWPWQSDSSVKKEPAAVPAPKKIEKPQPAPTPKKEPTRNFNTDQRAAPAAPAPLKQAPETKPRAASGFRWPWQKSSEPKPVEWKEVEPSKPAVQAPAPRAQSEPVTAPAPSTRTSKWSDRYWESRGSSTARTVSEPAEPAAVAATPALVYNPPVVRPKPEGSERWTTDWADRYWEKPKYSTQPIVLEQPRPAYVEEEPSPRAEIAVAVPEAPEEPTAKPRWRWPWQSGQTAERRTAPKLEEPQVQRASNVVPANAGLARESGPEFKRASGPNIKVPLAVLDFTATTMGPGKIQLSWRTSRVAQCSVQFGVAPKMLISKGEAPNPGNQHSVTLAGLKPGVNYYYQIVALDGKDTARSEVMHVRV